MSALYSVLACAVVASTAILLASGGANFLLSIPIVWLVGELLSKQP